MDLSFPTLLAACAVTLAGGFLKGAIGFGLPLVMVSGLALVLPPADGGGGDHPADRRLQRGADAPRRAGPGLGLRCASTRATLQSYAS